MTLRRREFVRTCCYGMVAVPIFSGLLHGCGSIYYATATRRDNSLVVAKSEFTNVRKNKSVDRNFVLIQIPEFGYPICLYKQAEEQYTAALLRCTHRGCELNLGGGVYTCPCHGSTFSTSGKVMEGPAEQDLLLFRTETDAEHVYIHLS